MTGFFIAISSFFKVFRVVHQYKVWSFYYIPLIFNGLLLFAFNWLLADLFNWGGGFLFDPIVEFFLLDKEGLLYSSLSFVIGVVEWLFKKIIIIYTFQYLSLILLAPLYSFVSEQLLNKLNGVNRHFSLPQLFKDIKRGLYIAFRNLGLQLLYNIPIFVFSWFFPPIGLLSILVSAYFYGFSMIDYRNEYYNYSVDQSIKFVRAHKGFAIGIGGMFTFMLLISSLVYLQFIAVIFAPVMAIAAAVIGLEKLDQNPNKN